MRSVCVLLLAASVPVQCSFYDIVAGRDGSVVMFATRYRLKGQEARGNIYRWTAAGFRAVEGAFGSPVMSGDGQVFGWNYRFISTSCPTGSRSCRPVIEDTGVVQLLNGTALRLSSFVQISRNGRWVTSRGELIDARNGIVTARYDAASVLPGRSVTSAGDVLTVRNSLATLRSLSGQERTAELSGRTASPAAALNITSASISDDARRIVYAVRAYGHPDEVRLYDFGNGSDSALRTGSGRIAVQPVSDDNGTTVAWIEDETGVVVWSESAGRRQITNIAEPAVSVALSGDGRVAWIGTSSGRLIRCDLSTGALLEVVGRTPCLEGKQGGETPGSLVWLYGTGLADRTESARFPLPEDLGGVRVRIGAHWCPIEFASPNRIRCQIPWEAPSNPLTEIGIPSESPFECQSLLIQLPDGPSVVTPHQAGLPTVRTLHLLVRADWSGWVTSESPARPGEILHLYATGLGDVFPPVPTGLPAPAEPLARLKTPMQCAIEGVPTDVLYEGLAPGLVGLYQVTVRLPERLGLKPAQSFALLECSVGDRSLGVLFPKVESARADQ